MRGAMGLEALPVIRQLSREPDLPVELAGADTGALFTCRIELASLRGVDLAREGLAEVPQQIRGERRKLVAIRAAVRLRRRTALALPQFDEQMQSRHLHRFLDALAELRLDALAQPARIILPVAEPRGVEGILVHGAGNIRRRPAARGSGLTLKSA